MTKRAVILDRDGVINDHRRFVNEPADFILFEHTAKAIRMLNRAEFLVLVATNQGGVGLGYLTLEQLSEVHGTMLKLLASQGAHIDDILACTHAPSAGCLCRKPKPGMLLEFIRRYELSVSHSYMVGDRETDVEAGQQAHMRTVHIGQGRTQADYQASDLLDAATWITQKTV